MIDRIFQRKGVIMILVLLLAVALAPWYTMKYHVPRPGPQTANLPDIPTAFTGRSNEIQSLMYYVLMEHVSVVAVTGGPGYGKSSIAIITSHKLVRLGIPVYFVPLSEVNSIDIFIMTFMHAIDGKRTEQKPDKGELFSWVSLLKIETVVVLNNADLLTLRQTDLRNNFLKLLKVAITRSPYLHLVVTTRYRFKFANDFAEIHLHPLVSTDAVALLKSVVLPPGQTSSRRDGTLEDEHLKGIANKTGGFSLALKVVGRLVQSGTVSAAQVLDELAVDPIYTFSRDSFTPDEQLDRCFNLSYNYLSQIMKDCLIYTARFPGTFDHHVRDAIIVKLTGDAHCLDQLVDRSLVEYGTVDERYAMHSLLHTFVANSITKQPPKEFFHLFGSHFITLLSTCIKEAGTGGNVNPLYTTIAADYHNILHILHIYANESMDNSIATHRRMLRFANQAFDVMKSRFPLEPLVEWWTAILNNVCGKVPNSKFVLLAPNLLSAKFGNLLLYHRQYPLARKILLVADQCVSKDPALVANFSTCQHPQADSYANMLQALMKAYEKDGANYRAQKVRDRLHYCIDSAPDKNPEDLITDNFCSVGIAYLQEKHSQEENFYSALELFDAHVKCFTAWEKADKLIKMLEDSCDYQLLEPQTQFTRAFSIAKRCSMVGNFEKEVYWLMKAATFAEVAQFIPLGKEVLLYSIHIHLNRLYWLFLDNAEKAVEHGKAAYSLAVKYYHTHDDIWFAAIRLADILQQIDGSQSEAVFFCEEALRHSPFLILDQETFYRFQKFAELSLVSMDFHAGQYRSCIQHYGQWAKLEATNAPNRIRKLIDGLFSEQVIPRKNVHSLLMMDSSVDRFLADTNTARRFVGAIAQKAEKSTVYYAMVLLIILELGIAFYLFKRLLYNVMHVFGLPQCHPCITQFYVFTIVLLTLVMYLASIFGVYLLVEQDKFASSPALQCNLSMHLYPRASLYYDLVDLPY